MKKMSYQTNNFYHQVSHNLPEADFDKPIICPHCCTCIDANSNSNAEFHLSGEHLRYILLSYKCTFCSKIYIVSYVANVDLGTSELEHIYPSMPLEDFSTHIQKLSPRFISVYNQSLYAEQRGDIDLAAMGIRKALEILIKDYAITELGESENEVSKITLCKCIDSYFDDKNLFNTADVVRILGNDYTHYKRKYPAHDFALLKNYMEIFIKQIESKLLAAHPPVSR